MPETAQTIILFVVVIVPGFLAMTGFRAGRAVPEHPEGLITTARVIAISVVIAVIAWRFGGRELYEHARAGTALTSNETNTYRFVIALLAIPLVAGFALAQTVDLLASRVWQARENLPTQPGAGQPEEPRRIRWRRWVLLSLSGRLLHDGPTTWDRTWKQIRRGEPYVYARVTTKGGRVLVGLVAEGSRVAVSPQPRDMYIEQVLRHAADGKLYPTAHGLGAFISGSEIESVEWVSHEGSYYRDGKTAHQPRASRGRDQNDRPSAHFGGRIHRFRPSGPCLSPRCQPNLEFRRYNTSPALDQ
ncbi:MAG: DUF6338 family protein [Solirubrobacteraceae bacterium]